MKRILSTLACISLALSAPSVLATTHYVDVDGTNATSPFTGWDTAATSIQDAIDASVAGDVVMVTNGIYSTGGKVMGGDLTNRVAIDKGIRVQSVNGPAATIIQGNWNPTLANGPLAVRCAWLTNGAVLSGFTIRGGATRSVTPSPDQQMNGGGVWGWSTAAIVSDCVIVTNTASYIGGGAYQVTLDHCTIAGNQALGSGATGGGAASCNLTNCVITGNLADQGSAGGTLNCNLKNCALTKNSSYMNGGAVSGGWLVNCTVSGNISSGYSPSYGGAVYNAKLTNCIIWANFSRTSYPNTNYASSTLTYCCSYPLPPGTGNTSADPQLLADGVHVTSLSPCRGIGTSAVLSGTDIDGQAWTNPPSMGCDEWAPQALVALQPSCRLVPGSRVLTFSAAPAGQAPFSYAWMKDGVLLEEGSHFSSTATTNLLIQNFGPDDSGAYQIIVSNSFNVVTSAVGRVVIHAVAADATNSSSPYLSWATAATNIQDAINIAELGDIVLVTNGVYANGGKAVVNNLTNRVAIDKPIAVVSVNGYSVTEIRGVWDPSTTNGPLSIRCAWVGDGAVLAGFTLRDGSTRASGTITKDLHYGGGVLGASTNVAIFNCLVTNNSAVFGGGIAYVTVNNSVLTANQAQGGGAAMYAMLNNCTVVNNFVTSLFNGAGTYDCVVRNSIVIGNYAGPTFQLSNYTPSSTPYSYSLTYPPGVSGNNNIISSSIPFLDSSFHLPATSPCRGAGNLIYAFGNGDLDNQSWNNPPSIGCHEIVDSNLVGPLSAFISAGSTNLRAGHLLLLAGTLTGQATRLDWSFGDGAVITNANYQVTHSWTNPGNYTVALTAYNNDNPNGITATYPIVIPPLDQPPLSVSALGGGSFQFNFLTQPTGSYTLQYATNLAAPVTWFTVQTYFSSTGGVAQIVPAASTNAAKFYRLTVQ